MKASEIYAIRAQWGFTQEVMARRMGLQRRAYIRIETGEQTVRAAHVLVLERVSIDIAVERGDRSLILPGVRYMVEHILALDQATSIKDSSSSDARRPDNEKARVHDREFVLNAWARGETSVRIATRIGSSPGYVRTLVKIARDGGDERAVNRGRTSNVSVRRIDYDAVLDRWYAGWPAAQIALFIGTSPKTVQDVVNTLRRRGDHRAVRRK